ARFLFCMSGIVIFGASTVGAVVAVDVAVAVATGVVGVGAGGGVLGAGSPPPHAKTDNDETTAAKKSGCLMPAVLHAVQSLRKMPAARRIVFAVASICWAVPSANS